MMGASTRDSTRHKNNKEGSSKRHHNIKSQGCKHKQHAASKSSKISKPIRKKPAAKSPAAKSPAAKSPAADKLKKLNALKKLRRSLIAGCRSSHACNGNNNSHRAKKDKKAQNTKTSTAPKKDKQQKDSDQSQACGSSMKARKPKRSKSKTRFTHVKRSKSRLQQEARTSDVSLPRLKYDTFHEHSLSTMKALECPKNLCHVEVCAKQKSRASVREMKNRLKVLLKRRRPGDFTVPFTTDTYLTENIDSMAIIPPKTEEKLRSSVDTRYQIHVYQTNEAAFCTNDWEEEDTVTAKHWTLPNKEFDGVWESLIFETAVKDEVLNYAMTMLMYSDKNIDRNIICCNRVVLLHGPPGTGKTSLCRAMAQKLCIRLSHKYRQGQLVEINSQGLFSKYYSESGKLVGKMFDKIQEFIDKKDSLVCILIDEVESLANNRKNMMNGNEPSDSMRVVNALLTRLDEIKRYPNVIVFTTTNVTKAIEAAFLDRADIKRYIGTPNAEAIYSVYRGCLHESMRAGIISPEISLLSWHQLENRKSHSSSDQVVRHSIKLKALSIASVGLSGRSLRKLPMLFHAEYLPAQQIELNSSYWEAMNRCVQNLFRENKRLGKDPEL